MNLILLFFVLPLATIIFSIALEKLLDNPFLVSAIIFVVFLIVAFVALGINFIIAKLYYSSYYLWYYFTYYRTYY